MTWAISTFRPGDLHGFSSRETLGLVESGHEPTTDVVWRLVATDAPLDAILDELAGTGLRSLPAFAFARFEEGGVRVVVRGPLTAEVETASGERHVAGGDSVRTWFEAFYLEPVAVSLAGAADDAGADGRSFELLAGVVPASSMARNLRGGADPRASFAEAEWTPPSAATAEAESAAAPLAPPVPPLANVTDHVVTEGHALSEHTLHERDTDGVAPALTAEDDAAFDHIFGHTVMRRVEDAAVRTNEEHGLISAVPPVPVPASAGPMPPPDADLGDHDGLTVSRAAFLAMHGDGALGGASHPGPPTVPAVFCEHGHPNPPEAASCRTCGGLPTGTPPVAIARPVLGVLVFTSGERVLIDRALLIGRNPKLASGAHGALPRFVRLDTAGPGLSRTHAEIRLEGWHALLSDAQSSNGTEVTLPGHVPRRLHPGDAVALVPGAVVDLGGEVQFTVEAVT